MNSDTDPTGPEPINTDPPYIPNADVYDTHHPDEWIAITDTIYADVINGCWLEDYHLSIVALEGGLLWIHIVSGWRNLDQLHDQDHD